MCVQQLVQNDNGENIKALGWGLLSEFSPFRYFPHFPLLSKQTLAIEYHVYIWQVSPQLSCGDTCQIWMWFRESSRCFCKIENFAYGEISERSFSNPHPCITFVRQSHWWTVGSYHKRLAMPRSFPCHDAIITYFQLMTTSKESSQLRVCLQITGVLFCVQLVVFCVTWDRYPWKQIGRMVVTNHNREVRDIFTVSC